MKKWTMLIVSAMLITGTAQAGCGGCESHAKEAEKKAACELKAGENKAECAIKDAKCAAEKKAECAKEKACCGTCKGEVKAECAKEKACCGTCQGEKKGKKWYNPVSWFK